jgi:hypothetical protein
LDLGFLFDKEDMMTGDDLNKLPHRTTTELEAIPHITLRVREDSKNQPAFLRGSKTIVFYPTRAGHGWLGFFRMPRTGDFYRDAKHFSDEDYELVS